MSFIRSSISALGKLLFIGLLAVAFLAGMAGVVYKSLQGNEIKVPEIVGKNYGESETELASLGLKIHKKADRYSTEAPNTVLEQLPRPGETVKTGQWIYVVTSKQSGESGEVPTTLNKNTNEQDDTEKIEEMISDKPKKPKANANVNKKKTRDVLSNTTTSDSNSGSNSSEGNSNKTSGSNDNSSDKTNKSQTTPPTNKQPAGAGKANTKPSGGDVRPRTTPKP
jgi:beta-lactam-binding protein with PASTA domain